MNAARERILGRLRGAPVSAEMPLPDVGNWFASHRRNEDSDQRISRLRSALEASQAEVHDTTCTDWPTVLLRIAAAKRLRTLLIGEDTPHGAALEARHANGLANGLTNGLNIVRYTESIDSWRASLFDDIDAGLSLARSAIAETGSLILWPDAHEPRLMSLVPPLHFVLLDSATIHADLHAAMVAENWMAGLPSNALLISGPSKTADIQQTLAYGAHGPRELIVLLVHSEGAAA